MDIIDDMNAHEDYMCSHSFGLVVVDAIIETGLYWQGICGMVPSSLQ